MEILQLSPPHHHHLPCSPSSTPTDYDAFHQPGLDPNPYLSYPVQVCYQNNSNTTLVVEEDQERDRVCRKRSSRERDSATSEDQVSLLAVFVTVFRKSLVGACRSFDHQDQNQISSMEIGVPTNVRHVAHVTFDRFNGFLGLPVEFEPEVPRRPPSASTSVFGVSTESMQLSFDSRGNSVPTILLMMQRRLYSQGGLQAEGIFRINGANGQEEYIREQLNKGEVPENVDVHCLAGLIKAWFRELPNGVLDSLEPEQVMQAESEEECCRLVRLLPPTEASLMDWAINLMADVAQLENHNKMNARNIAMVFAPNMTQMDDPLTALMYAVQVMNFLKTLIVKTLREREDSIIESCLATHSDPSDENEHQRSSRLTSIEESNEIHEEDQVYLSPELSEVPTHPHQTGTLGFLTSIENIVRAGKRHSVDHCESPGHGLNESSGGTALNGSRKTTILQSSNSKSFRQVDDIKVVARGGGSVEKSRGNTIVSQLNSRTERIEAWR